MANLNSIPLPRRLWWPWDQPLSRVAFECTFTARQASPAVLLVAASGPYQAWLDGAGLPIPDGPLPSWRALHQIPLELFAGEHALRIEATPGDPTAPFLLACLDWHEDGQPKRACTGAGWRMAADPPAGWETRPADLEWRPAWAFDGPWAEPWGMPCNAPVDFCRLTGGWHQVSSEKSLCPVRTFAGLTAADAAAAVHDDGALELHPARPYAAAVPRLEQKRPRLEWYRSREAHSLQLNTWLDLFEPRAPHVVLDAGAETFARLRLRLRSGGPAIVAITTGESLPEVDRYARRVTDIVQLHDGESFTTTPTGLRYVKIMALSAGGGPAILEPVEIEHVRYPAEQPGSFRCSDPVLNEIWDLSARTLHLCMQNEVWDGIKRDQLPWMGDLYTEALASYHLFGPTPLVQRTLAILAEIGPAPARPLEEQLYPGLVATWKKPGGDINDIPSYTMWWVAGLADYFLYSGDLELIRGLAAELEATLAHIAGWVDADGFWRPLGGWDYVDWAPLPAQERHRFCHLLAAQVLGQGADLLERVGLPGARYHALQEQLIRAARTAWWRDGRGELGVDPAWLGDDPHAVSMIGGEYARYGGYETSLCHGWSAGPLPWLHQAVLGVRPAAPGFAAITFLPDLGGLEWAEGTVPTPRGRIHVRLRDGAAAELEAPEGVEIGRR